MITGDLDAAIAVVISHEEEFRDALAVGTPWGGTGPADTGLRSAGSWRPAPAGVSGAVGTYATPAAFGLARARRAEPAPIAAALARALNRLDWVGAARSTGAGYLTVTVTAGALTALAPRIAQAGGACARSTALAGTTVTAPRHADLAAAPNWAAARRLLTAVVTGRLARAAGAQIRWAQDNAKRMAPLNSPASAGSAPVADAIDFAGADAITYMLARLSHAGRVDPRRAAEHHCGNPAYAVAYAHAHAASTVRQAADLGLSLGDAAELEPRLPAHPREMSLLYELSWLPERVSGAARRARPDVLARYLERVADAYLSCQVVCPALAPGRPPGPHSRARLWLVAAAQTVLRTGLGLLTVSVPDRL